MAKGLRRELTCISGSRPVWVMAAGFMVDVVLSIFPIVDVTSWASFSIKISGVIVNSNVVGYGVCRVGRQSGASRIRAPQVPSE